RLHSGTDDRNRHNQILWRASAAVRQALPAPVHPLRLADLEDGPNCGPSPGQSLADQPGNVVATTDRRTTHNGPGLIWIKKREYCSRGSQQQEVCVRTERCAMEQLNYDEIRLLRELKNSERRVAANKLDVGLERLVKEGYATTFHPNVSETLYSITTKSSAALHQAQGND